LAIEILNLLVSSAHGIDPIFFDIGIIIVFATLIAFTLRVLKQPIIPAYVLAGLLIGPYGLSLISNQDVITTFSELGIAFLLFVVGIEMDFKRLRSIGLISGIGGTIQIFILAVTGWIIAVLLGFSAIEATYIAMIVSFSSTMLVIKLLADKNELDTLHGRIIIGFLLVEDVFAILSLLFLSNFNNIATSGVLPVVLIMLIEISIMILFAVVLSRFVFPYVFKMAARSQEILFLFAITVCFVFAFLTNLLGLSIAIGAFIGGLSIANLPYNYEIVGKIKSLRIFFTTIFFAALGMRLNVSALGKVIIPLIILVLFISLLKPLITSLICSFFGYKKRTSILTSMSLAQTSEFSLIIVALGISPAIGHLSQDSIIPSLAILLSVVTMVITSYTIKFDTSIYDRIKEKLNFLDRFGSGNREIEMLSGEGDHDVIMIGYDRIGFNVLRTLQKMKKKIVVIDFNPEVVRNLLHERIDCIYGDVSDTEILKRLNIKNAEMIISTVPDLHDNLLILELAKKQSSKAAIFVTASKVDDALELYEHGADYVILPHFLGGHHVSVMLEEESIDLNKMLKKKLEHIKELEHRKNIGHEHPLHHRLHHD